MNQPKVFEFAKELGIETLVLMDKIREWKMPVKNHMAELDPELIQEIRGRLIAENQTKRPAAKKVAKKKVATKALSPTAPSAPTKKAIGKKQATSPAAPSAATSASSRVIRRKASDPQQESQLESQVEQQADADDGFLQEQEQESPVANSANSIEEVMELSAPKASKAAVEEVIQEESQIVKEVTEPSVTESLEDRKSLSVSGADSAPTSVSVSLAGAGDAVQLASDVQAEVSSSSASGSELSAREVGAREASAEDLRGPERKIPSRRKEVVLGPPSAPGARQGPRIGPPRGNIVGRMDLSRVSAPPPSLSSSGPRPVITPRSQGQGGPGFPSAGGPGAGPQRLARSSGPRNMRAGFVAPVILDEPIPEQIEERKSRFDEKTRKKAKGEKEKEEEVQIFSATEYRKREMVFQPRKKKTVLNREAMRTEITVPKASKRVIKVTESMSVSELAQNLGIKIPELTKKLMGGGIMATVNTVLDFDTIALIVPEFGFEAQNVHQSAEELIEDVAFGELEAEKVLRPPVVTVMGHVDHGKTTLLDAIRKSNVAKGEAGGITQHIGAYSVTTEDGRHITFIDTPGHEAFTAMRARGANVTDIVIIVVAADDGVMPQTVEAINHAKAAGVPIIVAVNKMDRQGANPDRIKQQLSEHQLVPEEWGGDTAFCPVSALKGDGIRELLENVYVNAEVLELKSNPKRSATGVVIEARMDRGRGCVATLLVRDGTLKAGQFLVAGTVAGKVRAMLNDRGERIDEAGPGTPVEILGLNQPPLAGDRFDITPSENAAQEIAQARLKEAAAKTTASTPKVTLEELFAKVQKGDLKELVVVLKADVAGSVEAVKGLLDKLGTDEIKVKIVHSAVGGVTESDVLLASTAKGIVVGFNVRPDGAASALAKEQGVEIKTYTIVYELIDDIKKSMSGLLAPEVVEKAMGRAEVREIFVVPKMGAIAGCLISDGKINRNSLLRLVRDGRVVYEGKVGSLRRFKDDVKEVAAGFECGIGIENFNDIKAGDVIEAFVRENVARVIG